MRNRKRSHAELESDLDAKAAPGGPFERILYLMEQIATEENWLDYYNSKNKPAPLVEKLIATMRAELHALMDDDPASINSAGAVVYRTEPPAENLGRRFIISGGEVLELDDEQSWADTPPEDLFWQSD